MARHPKPKLIKDLESNVRKLKTGATMRDSKMPRKPKYVTGEAAKIWVKTVPKLRRMGVMAETDELVLAGYCCCMARWIDAEKAIEEHGTTFTMTSGYVQVRPEVAVARDYQKRAVALAGKMGFSPLDRERISIPVKPTNGKQSEGLHIYE